MIYWGKVFLAHVMLVSVIVFAIVIAIIDDISSEPDTPERDSRIVYAILLIVSLIFFVLFAWDAVLFENSIQLVTFLFFAALMAIYAFVQLVGDVTNGLLIAQFLVLFLGVCVAYVLGYKVYSELGWSVYKKVGADPRMRALYRTYLILVTLLKLDFALAIILIAQNTALALETDDPEFALNICAVLLVIAYTIIGVLAVRQESNPAVYLFFALSPLEPAYIIFKIVRFLTVKGKGYDKLPRGQLISSGIVAILLRVILVAVAFKCWQNFGKGLTRYIVGEAGGVDDRRASTAGGKGTQLEPAKRRSTYDVNSLGSYNSQRTLRMD